MTDRDDDFTELLAQRLPQHPAPLALKRKLAAQWETALASGTPALEPSPTLPWWRRRPVAMPALVAALLLIVALPVAYDRAVLAPGRATTMLAVAAVEGHVRTTQAPLGIESSGRHDVKPWFTGKLDFAPSVAFMGDDEFPLRGGSIGSYADRPAAVLLFGRRKHTISLLVFRPEHLPALSGPTTPMGTSQAVVTSARGFNVVLWRDRDLGYALVSDVDRSELLKLGAKLAG